MSRKNFNARALFVPNGPPQIPGYQASTTQATEQATLLQTDERPPVVAGGPSAPPRVHGTRGAVRGHRTRCIAP